MDLIFYVALGLCILSGWCNPPWWPEWLPPFGWIAIIATCLIMIATISWLERRKLRRGSRP